MPPRPHTITDEQLRELFARHCECRPLDLARTVEDHAAIHDCDTGILSDVQVVLEIRFADRGVSPQAREQARARCAKLFHAQRNRHGGWDV